MYKRQILNHISNRYTRKELEKLKDVLDLLKEKGIAILLLESSCERVCSGTDSLYVLRGGRVEGIFERKEYDPGKIKRVMLGDYEIPDTQKTQFFYENDKTLLLEDVYKRQHQGKRSEPERFSLKRRQSAESHVIPVDHDRGRCISFRRAYQRY